MVWALSKSCTSVVGSNWDYCTASERTAVPLDTKQSLTASAPSGKQHHLSTFRNSGSRHGAPPGHHAQYILSRQGLVSIPADSQRSRDLRTLSTAVRSYYDTHVDASRDRLRS